MVVNDSGKKSFKTTTTTVGFQSFCGVKENRRGIIMFQDFCWTSSTTGKNPRGNKILKKLLFKHLFTITFLSASIVRDSTNLFYSSFTICQFCPIFQFFLQFSVFVQFSILVGFSIFVRFSIFVQFSIFGPIFNFVDFSILVIFQYC